MGTSAQDNPTIARANAYESARDRTARHSLIARPRLSLHLVAACRRSPSKHAQRSGVPVQRYAAVPALPLPQAARILLPSAGTRWFGCGEPLALSPSCPPDVRYSIEAG